MIKDLNKDSKDDFTQPEPRLFTRRFALVKDDEKEWKPDERRF
jgi:hypothetical protein